MTMKGGQEVKMNYKDFCLGVVDLVKNDFYESKHRKSWPERGDIIYKNSGPISHFGIYVNDNRIIHYAPRAKKRLDLLEAIQQAESAIIHAVSLDDFLQGNKEFFVCNCPKVPLVLGVVPDPISARHYKLYTPQECVERAEFLSGRGKYHLLKDNCETFAFFCKTGIHETLQAFNFLKGVRIDKINLK